MWYQWEVILISYQFFLQWFTMENGLQSPCSQLKSLSFFCCLQSNWMHHFYFDYRHMPSYLGTNVSVSIQTETVLVDQSGSFADMKANMHARICVKFQHFEWRYLFFMIFTKTQCSQCFIWRISIILSLSSWNSPNKFTAHAGTACCQKQQTGDQKVACSSPGRSGGGTFFSRVNFICWFTFSVYSTLCYRSST